MGSKLTKKTNLTIGLFSQLRIVIISVILNEQKSIFFYIFLNIFNHKKVSILQLFNNC